MVDDHTLVSEVDLSQTERQAQFVFLAHRLCAPQRKRAVHQLPPSTQLAVKALPVTFCSQHQSVDRQSRT